MEKFYLNANKVGNNVFIECEDEKRFLVSSSIIEQLIEYTDTEEEAINLYSYLRNRISDYNNSLDICGDWETARGDYSQGFMKDILIFMLRFMTPDLIIDTFDNVSDYDLFSNPQILKSTTEEAKNYVLAILMKNSPYLNYEEQEMGSR